MDHVRTYRLTGLCDADVNESDSRESQMIERLTVPDLMLGISSAKSVLHVAEGGIGEGGSSSPPIWWSCDM
jgi:hypothetical protein